MTPKERSFAMLPTAHVAANAIIDMANELHSISSKIRPLTKVDRDRMTEALDGLSPQDYRMVAYVAGILNSQRAIRCIGILDAMSKPKN